MSNEGTELAITDVLKERMRQKTSERYTDARDDEHNDGQLAKAAYCYIRNGVLSDFPTMFSPPGTWPWDRCFWKPKSRRRDLVRAAALLIAEIERLDRASNAKWGQEP